MIPHNERLLALNQFFDVRPNLQPDTTHLRLTKLVPHSTAFCSRGNLPTGLGADLGPNHGNLFVGYVEAQIFTQFIDQSS